MTGFSTIEIQRTGYEVEDRVEGRRTRDLGGCGRWEGGGGFTVWNRFLHKDHGLN
jgi:hypothetical protein